MSQHTRTATAVDDHASPAWKPGAVARFGGFLVTLARWLGAILRERPRPCILAAAAFLCLVGQVVLLCVALYLVDLTVSLMEVWAELARKHLEITLS